MRRIVLAASLSVLTFFTGVRVSAQAIPGQRLTVHIETVAVAMRADTTRVTYTLVNHATSDEELFRFIVDAPAPVVWILHPTPDSIWSSYKVFVGRSVAGWAFLGEQMSPGDTSPQLFFEAVGVPGLVDGWVRGYFPPPQLSNEVDTLPYVPVPGILELSLKSTVVGVSPIPPGITTSGFNTRLDSLTTRTCSDLSWISSSALCTALRGHLTTAASALGNSDGASARTALEGFISELDAAHSPPSGAPAVNGSAYWLLQANATWILSRIPATQQISGRNLTIDINVVGASMRSDTTRLTYVLVSRPTSIEPLFSFDVDAPAPVTWILVPEPAKSWLTTDKAGDRTVAGWAVLSKGVMVAGDTSPSLSFDAVGVPGIVDAWVRGDYALQPAPDSIDHFAPIPDYLELSIKSTTVGISPLPAGITPLELVARLDSLTARSCGDLAWITSSELCTTLHTHLTSASTALGKGNSADAVAAIESFTTALDDALAPPAAPQAFNGSGYWLLRPNATWILGQIPVSAPRSGSALPMFIFPIAAIFAILAVFYFLRIRPQEK